MLLTAGERISNALVAMAISALGAKAISFTGSQAGMITTAKHGDARIVQVTPHRLRKALDEGNIVLVAGFQGVSQDSKDVTTLGRGGSDTTAVALAAALEADVCEIYTDVDGIFSADPRIVADARLVADITYEEMLEMAASGAKVLHLRAVEYARRYQVPLRVRSSYNEQAGQPRHRLHRGDPRGRRDHHRRGARPVRGQDHRRRRARHPRDGGADLPHGRRRRDQHRHGAAERQPTRARARPTSPSPCRAPTRRGPWPRSAPAQAEIGFGDLLYDGEVGKVSLVGAGMRNHPGVTATFCEALSAVGINIETMNTSEIRISVICREEQLDDAVRALHAAFELGGDELAVVHAGTGR